MDEPKIGEERECLVEANDWRRMRLVHRTWDAHWQDYRYEFEQEDGPGRCWCWSPYLDSFTRPVSKAKLR